METGGGGGTAVLGWELLDLLKKIRLLDESFGQSFWALTGYLLNPDVFLHVKVLPESGDTEGSRKVIDTSVALVESGDNECSGKVIDVSMAPALMTRKRSKAADRLEYPCHNCAMPGPRVILGMHSGHFIGW